MSSKKTLRTFQKVLLACVLIIIFCIIFAKISYPATVYGNATATIERNYAVSQSELINTGNTNEAKEVIISLKDSALNLTYENGSVVANY